tara:strand:- start:681 stop:1283 length:603 start_codon:yes stop_codon:yes gene_type:complete
MIDQLKGTIDQKTLTHAIIFVGGIGLKLNMSINSLSSLPKKGTKVSVLTYLHIREDIMDLYGFVDFRERNAFNLLISISGIGPKLAITILSGIDSVQLKNRVVSGDVAALMNVPGVGSKTAKRIIIELKEKFTKLEESDLGLEDNNENHSQLFDDLLNALIALGYKNNHAKKVCIDIEKKGEMKGSLELVIKKALKILVS